MPGGKQQHIRLLYEEHGAEAYYREHGLEYSNPHEAQIRMLVERNLPRLDTSGGVLDFAAGSGEVTRALQAHGLQQITGCDPFTADLYEAKTGIGCLRLSFRDVMLHGLEQRYSLIISSFALHLCPHRDLYLLTWQLLQAAPMLAVITPHKRPELEQLAGIRLLWEDAVATGKGKLVRMKAYAFE